MSVLDEMRLDRANDALQRLVELLADNIHSRDRIDALARSAGMKVERLRLEKALDLLWWDVLDEARRQDRQWKLVEKLKAELPTEGKRRIDALVGAPSPASIAAPEPASPPSARPPEPEEPAARPPPAAATPVHRPLHDDLERLIGEAESVLRSAPGLARALLDRDYGERAHPDVPACLARALADAQARKLANDLAQLAVDLRGEGDSARRLLWHILPLAIDWRAVLSDARAAPPGSALELPLCTETVAEVVLAGVHGRPCRFLPGDEALPRGATLVSLPAAAYIPVFDPRCEGLADAILHNLYAERMRPAPRGSDRDVWGPIRQRFPDAPRFKKAAKSRIQGSPASQSTFYMLVIDADLPPQRTADVDHWWASAKGVLARALPGLQLVRLTASPDQLDGELHLATLIKDLCDLS
jgi:hypothetical protein